MSPLDYVLLFLMILPFTFVAYFGFEIAFKIYSKIWKSVKKEVKK